jgi:poly-gamma-glutamate synthesis protein (capsule biosynthesis protein)
MPPWGQAPGRPGINALRTKRITIVPPEIMETFRKIDEQFKEARKQRNIETIGAPQEQRRREKEREKEEKEKGEITLFGTKFRQGDSIGYTYEMESIDVEEILRNVRNGKQYSDFMLATIHSHQGGLGRDDIADFHQKLAHAVIDAGADVFIGHGVHRLRPIEIYKGKPIFYSLGDFFWDDKQEPYAADYFEQYKEDLIAAFGDIRNATNADMTSVLNSKSWGKEGEDNLVFQSVIAESKYQNGQVSEIRLYPVDLQYGKRLTESGVPRVPSPEKAQQILERLKKMSEPFGTKISIENNIGIIRVPPLKKNP